MGNLPSKDNMMERRVRPFKVSISSSKADLFDHSRLLKKTTNSGAIIIAPIRHELVLTDYATPLVSLSAASAMNQKKRRLSIPTNTVYTHEFDHLSTSLPSSTRCNVSKDVWVYEYGAEKERDRYFNYRHT